KGCGRCKHCKVGWAQLCRQGIVVYGMTGHGGHAAYMTVPAYTLVPLPDSLSFEEGAAISCGTGTAYQALKRLDVSGRDTLAVFGQGPVGLSAVLLGQAMGARVIAVDPVAERRKLAGAFGADQALDPAAGAVVAALRERTAGAGDATRHRGRRPSRPRAPRRARARALPLCPRADRRAPGRGAPGRPGGARREPDPGRARLARRRRRRLLPRRRRGRDPGDALHQPLRERPGRVPGRRCLPRLPDAPSRMEPGLRARPPARG